MKKFVNAPEDVVKESLAGLAAAHPDLLRVDFENQVVLRKDAPVAGKVGLVSGGGSGHEPLHGGFVGRGMLDAACPGEIFTSPVPDQMLAATKAVDGGTRVNDRGRSFGVALTSCVTPSAGSPTFDIGSDEVEFGVGIHGEPGRRREKLKPASEIVADMTEAIVGDLAPASGAKLLAFVNGLGGTPLIELYLVYNELAKQLADRGLTVARNLVGNYITSLEMAGVSLTLVELAAELPAPWDAPVHTPAFRWGT